MATSAATLIQRCRRFMGDWPENDALTASVASNGTTISVADSSTYAPGWLVQIESEALYVSALPSGTTLTVRRGVRGSTAATHATSTTVLVRPHFLDLEYLDALNAGINATFPWLYQPVIDESLVTAAGTYEYTVPNLNSTPIPMISQLEFKEQGDLSFRGFSNWYIRRGATPKIHLKSDLPTGTLRVYGFGPLPALASLSASLDAQFPTNAEDALVLYACQQLLASGEARRVREDTGARDDREQANRTGSSMAASNAIYSRFRQRLIDSGFPPMPRHATSVF